MWPNTFPWSMKGSLCQVRYSHTMYTFMPCIFYGQCIAMRLSVSVFSSGAHWYPSLPKLLHCNRAPDRSKTNSCPEPRSRRSAQKTHQVNGLVMIYSLTIALHWTLSCGAYNPATSTVILWHSWLHSHHPPKSRSAHYHFCDTLLIHSFLIPNLRNTLLSTLLVNSLSIPAHLCTPSSFIL